METTGECHIQEALNLVESCLKDAADLSELHWPIIRAELLEKQNVYNKTELNKIRKEFIAKEEFIQSPIDDDVRDFIDGLSIPSSYHLTKKGVAIKVDGKGYDKFINGPVIVSKKTLNLETGSVGVQLKFKYGQVIKKVNLPLDVISSKNSIVKLSSLGLPVTSENAGQLIKYLDEQRSLNLDKLPEIKTISKNGWFNSGDSKYFCLGSSIIGPNGKSDIVEREVSELNENLSKGIRSRGKLEKWVEAFNSLKKFPIVLFQLGAVAAAPLLELIEKNGFMVNVWDNSTSGKTVANQFALSLFGDPTSDGICLSWKTTINAAESRAYLMNGLPCSFDDLSQVRNQRMIEDVIYMIGNNTGKTRSMKTGDLRKVKTFKTIGISSGEEPCVNMATRRGQEVRTIEVNGSPFSDKSTEMGKFVSSIKETIIRNFGLVGPSYVQGLVDIANTKSDLEELIDRYDDIRSELSQDIEDTYLLRSIDNIALVQLGLESLRDVFKKYNADLSYEEISKAVNTVLEIQKQNLTEDKNIDNKALSVVWDNILSEGRRDEIEEYYEPKYKLINAGTENEAYVIIPTDLKHILEKEGLNSTACMTYFKNNGWVRLDKEGGLLGVNIGGHTKRCFAFLKSKAIEVGILHQS